MASVTLINNGSLTSSAETSVSRFYRVTDERTAVTTAGISYLIITPDTSTRIHLTYTGTGESITLTIQLFEAPTVTSNGTALDEIPLRRDSIVPAELQVFYNPAVTLNGTQLSLNKSILDTNLVIAPEIIPENQFVLAQNTLYLLKLTPSADGATVDTVISWNEVKNV